MKERIFGYIRKAERLRGAARYAEALKLFRKAGSLSRKHGDLDGILDATLATADICRMTGDFDNAVKNYEEALEASEALGNRLTAADCMVGMGLSLRAMGMWKESLKFISAARKIYRKEDDRKGTAFSLWAEAGALRVAGDIGKAIEKFREAKEIFSSLRFRPGIAYALCGLGGTHRVAGKYGESLKYYRQANRMFAAMKDTFGTAYSHCGIGNALRMKEDYRGAMEHFRKAERLYCEIGDIVSYSYTLWSIANVFKMRGDFAGARLALVRALRNFKKTKDPRGIVYCGMTEGELKFMEGRKRQSEQELAAALAAASAHGFKLEKCHAGALLALVRSASGGRSRASSCYVKIGVGLKVAAVPFNMP